MNGSADGDGLIESDGEFNGGVDGGVKLRQGSSNGVNGVDNISSGLTENNEESGMVAIGQAERAYRLYGVCHPGHITQTHGGAILILEQNGPIIDGVQSLVIGGDHPVVNAVGETSFGLVRCLRGDGRADTFEAEAVMVDLRWI